MTVTINNEIDFFSCTKNYRICVHKCSLTTKVWKKVTVIRSDRVLVVVCLWIKFIKLVGKIELINLLNLALNSIQLVVSTKTLKD